MSIVDPPYGFLTFYSLIYRSFGGKKIILAQFIIKSWKWLETTIQVPVYFFLSHRYITLWIMKKCCPGNRGAKSINLWDLLFGQWSPSQLLSRFTNPHHHKPLYLHFEVGIQELHTSGLISLLSLLNELIDQNSWSTCQKIAIGQERCQEKNSLISSSGLSCWGVVTWVRPPTTLGSRASRYSFYSVTTILSV